MIYERIVPEQEFWDEKIEEFVNIPTINLKLCHSLISVSKWESKYKEPFLSKDLTVEELIAYIQCMDMTNGKDKKYFRYLPSDIISEISDYVADSYTATKIRNINHSNSNNSGRNITSEIIYSWMFELGIPLELERWHFNRLITLIRVIREEHTPKEKMSAAEWARIRSEENERRKQKYKTSG